MNNPINMTKKLTLINAFCLAALALALTYTQACTPDDSDLDNGLADTELSASFTVTPVAGKMNTYALRADNEGVLGIKWRKSDGAQFITGKVIDTVVYEDAGTYTITAEVNGRGGVKASSSKEVVVAASIPLENNIVKGGFMDPGDQAFWLPITYSPGVSFAIVNGKMVATGGNGGHAGIYQAVQVQAGKRYQIDMNVTGSGATDVWFEVYLGTDAPGAGDYNSGGNRMGLNTWTGCGKTAFDGKLSSISCVGSGGLVTATQTGTMYLVIRGGGSNLGASGIAIDRIGLVEVQ